MHNAITFDIDSGISVSTVASESVIDKPNSRIISKLDWMDSFTDEELAKIYTAAKATIEVEIWLERFRLVKDSVDLDDPRTISGVQSLETLELIGPGRADEILQVVK